MMSKSNYQQKKWSHAPSEHGFCKTSLLTIHHTQTHTHTLGLSWYWIDTQNKWHNSYWFKQRQMPETNCQNCGSIWTLRLVANRTFSKFITECKM